LTESDIAQRYRGGSKMSFALAFVMPGFMPGIHVFTDTRTKTWIAGTSPAMTA
jgi:hypothetical protein